ncbi:hypothetical protein TVAG_086010 [Trichomonas vaginalis G3]|uniref:SNF2 N-terminal domain-containing protein n=1 Tax=Trichomonas vaginalis (strain ATCC PRA-98 / G3) TaxID=412133 RepID=A2FXY7_TRIV3|nr:helicase protein [Trichomonas vaginalis G3]EAX90228.1 hypothetical protein TVAG_086010 [Trichomonas vaginalis G3]KAI5522996.1 helicase protein [Trichomonas vaginalis G3]|eukprot:XP_001303158.1 hypothetical protein [Trichomonas vaginalis G3]
MRSRRRTAIEEGTESSREVEQRPGVRGSPRRAAQRAQSEASNTRIFLKTPMQPVKPDPPHKKLSTHVSLKLDHVFQYPPKQLKLPTTKAENIAANISKSSSAFLCSKWLQGTNCVLIDETKSIKYAAVSIFIEKIRSAYSKCPPFLLIAQPKEISVWVEQLKYWTSQSISVCTSDQSERDTITDQQLLLDVNPTSDYGIVITNYEQFINDRTIIPYRQWASVIADDPSPKMPLDGLFAFHKTFVGTEFFDEYPSLETFLEVPPDAAVDPSTVFIIKPEDAADDYLFEENFTPCPMAALQQAMYIELLQESSEKIRSENADIKDLCEFASKLRALSSHPFLATDTPCDIMTASGKVPVLSKLLSIQRNDGKKVAIFCNSNMVTALHTIMTECKTIYTQIEANSTENEANILIDDFNHQQGHRVIIVPANYASLCLEKFNGETVFAFDTDWTPIEDGKLIVKWHARNSKAQIYRLITSDSFEYVSFAFFWNNRDKKPSNFEIPEKSDKTELFNLIKDCYRLAYKHLDVVHQMPRMLFKEIRVLQYSDKTAFPQNSEPFLDEYWTMPEKHLSIHAPRQSRPLTPAQFWTEPRLQRYLQLFNLYGWGRWEKFQEFGRPEGDLQKLGVLFLKHLLKTVEEGDKIYPNVLILIKENNKFDQKRLLTSLAAWPSVFATAKVEPLLGDVENKRFFYRLIGEKTVTSPDDIDLSLFENDLDNRKIDDVKKLLFSAWEDGLNSLSEEDQKYIRNLIQIAKNKPVKSDKTDKKTSTLISLRSCKTKFDSSSHDKVLNTLMSYGFPSLEKFMQAAGLMMYSPESVQNYVDNIIGFCQTSSDDKKKFSDNFVKRIVKYHSQKIPLRVKLFEKVRECSTKFDEYSAEDIEFLTAVSSHGLGLWLNSPVLLCACRGQPTEAKLYNRVKLIFEETKRTKVIQRIPEDFKEKMPLRINDMMMLRNIGKIDKRFFNDKYVYPIDYHVSVQSYSLIHKDTKVWMYCKIELNDEKLNFVIWPDSDPNSKIEGKDPDDVFNQYRLQLQRFCGQPVTYIDGHEMYGLTSPLVNILLQNMEGIDELNGYQKRYFSSVIPLTQKWPVIGQFEKEPEAMVIAQPKATVQTVPPAKSSGNVIPRKFKFKKRVFGDLPPPLVVDFAPLAADQSKSLALDFTTGPLTQSLVDAFSYWSDFSDFLPKD